MKQPNVKHKRNLKKVEVQAITTLRNKNIIKPGDKGGATVIMIDRIIFKKAEDN